MEKQITIHFNLDKEIERRVYYAIMNLPSHFGGQDISEAVINFINDLVGSVMECEERNKKCEQLLTQINPSNLWN